MKWIFYLSVLVLFLASCTKTEDEKEACIPFSLSLDFRTAKFKTSYNIMLPSSYTGPGMVTTSKGNSFYKTRYGLVTLQYKYCDSISCSDFGQTLSSPEPASLEILVSTVQGTMVPVTLDKKIHFCRDGNMIAIFYYADLQNVSGRLYWLDGDAFKEALDISYSAGYHIEVLDILKSITKK